MSNKKDLDEESYQEYEVSDDDASDATADTSNVHANIRALIPRNEDTLIPIKQPISTTDDMVVLYETEQITDLLPVGSFTVLEPSETIARRVPDTKTDLVMIGSSEVTPFIAESSSTSSISSSDANFKLHLSRTWEDHGRNLLGDLLTTTTTATTTNKMKALTITNNQELMQTIVLPEEQALVLPEEQALVLPVEQALVLPVEQALVLPVEQALVLPVEQGLVLPVEQGLVLPVEQGLSLSGNLEALSYTKGMVDQTQALIGTDTRLAQHSSRSLQYKDDLQDSFRRSHDASKSTRSIPHVDHQKMYQDDVSLQTSDVFEHAAKGEYHDDQTIATYATLVTTAKGATPTIHEGDEEEAQEIEEKSTYSEQQSRATGLMQRPGYRPRKIFSSEVEVSMNGFLHQVKPKQIEAGETDGFQGYYGYISVGDEKIPKMNKLLQAVTVITTLGLVATCSFFAAHIGPFVVQAGTESVTTITSSAKELIPTRDSSLSSRLAIDGSDLLTSGSTFPIDGLFLNWTVPYQGPNMELPLIWTYPMSGGDILQEMFGRCLGKVQAGNGEEFDVGGSHAEAWKSDSLRVVALNGHLYVNVNLYTIEGIDRATKLGIAPARVADIAYTPLLHNVTKVFEPQEGQPLPEVFGRLLVVFRNPIERALNRYELLRLTTGDDQMTLLQYAKDPRHSENNPLTRGILAFGPNDPLESSDATRAQQVIKNFILVGLFDRFDEALERFERYLSWYANDVAPQVNICHGEVWDTYSTGYTVLKDYKTLDAKGYNLILAQHRMDILLYRFAQALFDNQGAALQAASTASSTRS